MNGKTRGLILILILISIPFIGPSLMRMAIIPGPEGLNVELYGIQFGEYSNELWKIQELSNNQILEKQEADEYLWPLGSYSSDIQIRCSFPEPRNTMFRKDITLDQDVTGLPPTQQNYYSALQIERERPTISEVNIHGDPLGGSESPTHIRYIEYHTPRITEGNQIEFTKYCIHVVPVDFVLQFSVRGDKWYGWSDTHLWLKINTIVWRNAFTGGQVEQIQGWLDKNPPINATLSAYDYRGGFPIWGWIGEWDPIVWYDEEERADQPPQEALDNVRIYPSLEGREITLYTTPGYAGDDPDLPDEWKGPTIPDPGDVQYFSSIDLGENLDDPQALENYVITQIPALPDPDFATVVYSPIYLDKFYPYYETGPWYDPWEKQWYPTTYMRVRLLYAIYGEFVYLWTEEEAEDQGYEWEERISQYNYIEGPWEALHSLGAFLVSPYGALTTGMILAAIVLIIIILINPALILGLFKTKKGGRRR